ncbi:MAG: bifunctional DNA-binding transcriptional regulator/O6-methylguanine-DNA methyltransferase Ada [Chloroflexi bacterium]|nr:bifunctional DNA-binding transcriptional regulator/O6-methylguanine-DNA methyltransferase Ada [Chloroflexota bacterium]
MTDDQRWQIVQRRDGRDADFVYAVRSTGIYCRPYCSARLPHRIQVVFFSTASDAEQAGFRACRRCQPEKAVPPESEIVRSVCDWIENNPDERVILAVLSKRFSLSGYHLQRTFRRCTGITPRQYAESCRISRLKAQLRAGESVTDALYDAGYGSTSRLYERAKVHLGMTPGAYRRGGRGMEITYGLTHCSLGRVIVGATKYGICALGLGHSDTDLEAFLKGEFPNARIQRDEGHIRQSIDDILNYLEGKLTNQRLPLDMNGTNFQRKVWDVLMSIPYGTTRSYSEIACLIGRPEATRAVARACATNPLAILVPCHRVVRKDGSPGGYRWGIRLKEDLLEKESSVR